MNFYLKSFAIFLKIGLFTIGGGYAMVPLIQDEIVEKRKWIDKEDFIDLLALTQSVPGIFAVNIAIFIGYKLRKFKGIRPAVVALIAAPTFSMATSAKINRYTIWIPIVSALLIWLLGISPVYIIIIAGVGGFFYGKYKHKHASK